MKKCAVIDWRLRSEIKTNGTRKQHQERQSRFDKLREISNDTIARSRKIRPFNRRCLHAETGSLYGAPGPATAGRPTSPCEMSREIAEMLTPKDSMTAPSATCAVATSAALLLQIVQAPSEIWQMTSATQSIESFLSAAKRGAARQTQRANAITAIAIMNARNRCVICSQVWNAVTSDRPRASRHALSFARAAALVSGIHAPLAVGKSRIDRSRC